MTFLTLFAIVLYLVATGLLARPLLGRGEAASRLAMAAASLAVIAHASVVFGMHRGALDLHFYAALSLTACVVAALTVVVNLNRPVAALGVIVFPLAALLLAVDVFLAPPTLPRPMDWQIKLHVSIALIAYGLLSLGAIVALLLAFQEGALRKRRLGTWLRALPPLTLTEALLFRLIGAGFLGLTLTLLSGSLFVENIRDQHLAHTIVLSVIAWIIFAALLWGRWRHGWRGRRAVNLTLAGMAMLALAFFGSKFVLEVLLQRVS
ncbi:cytochrome C assembly family protein [Dokdonella sp.]|uniref:cytochrome C assembly family protein n=1 Tax=Dokdonella sp. TaxID=2291710 RepID=UPI003AF7DD35